MKKIGSNMKRIVVATSVSIFSLATAIVGSYAWFAKSQVVTITGSSFFVTTSKQARIEPLKLVKFDYASSVIGGIQVFDYLKPSDGQVNTYTYDKTYDSNRGAFIRQVGVSEYDEASIMNPYDPVDQFIHGDDLRAMNCNSIYEATIAVDTYTNAYLHLKAIYSPKVAVGDEILLSDCADFEIYYASDVADDNPLFRKAEDDYTAYYPTDYTIKHPQDDDNEDDDVLYHKISYLSFLRNNISAEQLVDLGYLTSSQIEGLTEEQKDALAATTRLQFGPAHSNFYSHLSKANVSVATNVPVTFPESPKQITVYINVNYAPAQLEQYTTDIYTKNLTAIDDFYFDFDFTTEVIS